MEAEPGVGSRDPQKLGGKEAGSFLEVRLGPVFVWALLIFGPEEEKDESWDAGRRGRTGGHRRCDKVGNAGNPGSAPHGSWTCTCLKSEGASSSSRFRAAGWRRKGRRAGGTGREGGGASWQRAGALRPELLRDKVGVDPHDAGVAPAATCQVSRKAAPRPRSSLYRAIPAPTTQGGRRMTRVLWLCSEWVLDGEGWTDGRRRDLWARAEPIYGEGSMGEG